MEIVIASTNMHEIRELRAMLKSMRVFDIYSLHDFPTYTLPKQLGSTLQEIGCDRAIDASQAIGMVAISS
ncbi:MAG: non-canonical purine NTP pyrophosphatase, partial [Chlamydiia bacterium]